MTSTVWGEFIYSAIDETRIAYDVPERSDPSSVSARPLTMRPPFNGFVLVYVASMLNLLI